jgi:hypothetical protein
MLLKTMIQATKTAKQSLPEEGGVPSIANIGGTASNKITRVRRLKRILLTIQGRRDLS